MIYVYAPFYHDKSNGIAIAYELVRILNKEGIESKVLCSEIERYDFVLPEDLKPYYVSKAAVPKAIADDDVIIYLDTVAKDAPKAKKVIYWLLNRPGSLVVDGREFQGCDVLAAYSTLVHKDLPQLFILRDERPLFSRLRKACTRRSDTVSVYFGKVHIDTVMSRNALLEKLVKKYKKINVITRLSPMNREKMLMQVAQSDLLISYDSLSNINYEATLLGTPVLMMDDAYNLQGIQYNAGNYGLAFSEEGIKTARQQVHRAFDEYNKCLKNQGRTIADNFRRILEQLDLIHTKPEALQHNEDVNKKARQDFAEFNKSITAPFVNIDFPEGIPADTKMILEHAERKAASTGRQEAVQVTKEAPKARSLMRIYGKVKPRWVDTMYRKLPGDLGFKELGFLMFRRIAPRPNPAERQKAAQTTGKASKARGLLGFYDRIKPRWVDAMYRKLPGDLKLKELNFLMLRRLVLRLKR